MLRLEELQGAVTRAIVFGDTDRIAGAVASDGIAAVRRLRVYRNHYGITLREALAATYPVVRRLVGERCFSMLAREYITLSPPKNPCLFAYGDGFPLYLGAVSILDPYPYLPDVARLEWMLNVARHAPDAPALTGADLTRVPQAQFPSLVFSFHPACQCVASRFPIDRIWRANQEDSLAEMHIDLGEEPVEMLVQRDADGDVGWLRLHPAVARFIRRLRAARPLGEAWADALQCDAAFDGTRTLVQLIESRALIDFHIDPKPNLREPS